MMKILSALEKGIKTIYTEVNKSDSVRKGEAFEEYVREYIFTQDLFDLIDRTHAFENNRKDFIESSLNPDYKFRDKKSKRDFWVEVKFRSNDNVSKLNWCTEKQLKRYQECHKSIPTFLLLGVGGKADIPESLYLLSMSQAKYASLFQSVLKKFEIPLHKPISSQLLWNR